MGGAFRILGVIAWGKAASGEGTMHQVRESVSSARSPDDDRVVLRTLGLSKRFGDIQAVDSLDLEVRAGEVFGFLGPNGSGKSTTVGMILGLIEPTAGSVELFDRDLASNPTIVRRRVGAIIEAPAFYPYLSGEDNLRAIALAAGGVPEERIRELLSLVGLSERASSPFGTYSLGMKQRLGIASTLLTDPELVILDEPTNGLDPAGQREVRALIPRLAGEGRAVLLASHLLYEVEQVCDRAAIIRRGKLIQTGTIDELMGTDGYVDISINDPVRAARILRELPFVSHVTPNGGVLRVVTPREHAADLNRALVGEGLFAEEIVRHRASLEDAFLELTGDEAAVQDERSEIHA
jgi:ABC-2 type transport system ATP-binding protein